MAGNQPLLVNIGDGLSVMVGLPTIGSWKSENRPKNVKAGTFGFNLQTNKLEYWNGSYWLEASMEEA